MMIYINWKFAFAYKSERDYYAIGCLQDANPEYLTSQTLPCADKLVIEEDDVPIRYAVQILDKEGPGVRLMHRKRC
jgi:hypothetical protein